MSTVMAQKGHQMHSFEYYPSVNLRRSKFDRSQSLITTMNAGYLVPIWHDLAYPGDTLILSARTLTRLATQIVPFMSNVYMDVHFWCVPIRLIWENWVKMNGEQANPGDSTDYLTPLLNSGTVSASNPLTVGSIYDYFNVPIGVDNLDFNAFNFRAYNLVWNEWYRDENLQNRVSQVTGDTDSTSNYTLLKRGKRKDYFTGALPWPQKGQAVDLPLGSTAPVVGNGMTLGLYGYESGYDPVAKYGGLYSSVNEVNDVAFTTEAYGKSAGFSGISNPTPMYNGRRTIGVTPEAEYSGLVADLSNATAATINSLRQAFAVQRIMERDAIGGTRYIEQILAHFGVKSPDMRLQRPEFLGGGTFDLNLSIVPQTSSTNSTSPLGELASYGVINGATKRIVHSFTEHCIVFGVASIRSEYYYQQGLERDYSRRSRIDYYLPATAHLGEQAVLNKEIYAQGKSVVNTVSGTAYDEEVFGYQERWAEMRYKNSYITGQVRSTAAQPLDMWHLATEYNSLPKLNSTFIQENPPINRVIAIDESANTPQFISNFYFDEYWIRPMPVYSTPGYIDHF